jgi:hypothetical protein
MIYRRKYIISTPYPVSPFTPRLSDHDNIVTVKVFEGLNYAFRFYIVSLRRLKRAISVAQDVLIAPWPFVSAFDDEKYYDANRYARAIENGKHHLLTITFQLPRSFGYNFSRSKIFHPATDGVPSRLVAELVAPDVRRPISPYF